MAATESTQAFLAREPIVDRKARVCGYRILVGETFGGPAIVAEAEQFAVLTGGRDGFVTLTRDDLLRSPDSRLHPRHAIIDLPSSMGVDAEVEAACGRLRDAGYRFSIADFTTDAAAVSLAEFATFLKVDCTDRVDASSRTRAVADGHARGAVLIGTGIHTPDALAAAASEGIEYFQGFVLGQLLRSSSGPFSGNPLPLLHLLRALKDPMLSITELEDLVKHDPALCYRILRTVNSAAFAVRATVTSMGQAILLLGRDTIRRWASLWTMVALGADSHEEVVVMSAVRARLCETVVSAARGADAGGEAFLVGMCSLFDVVLGQPMADIAAELPVDDQARRVLCGEPGPMRDVLDCVIAHERGDWEASTRLARRAGLDARLLPGAYLEALRWVRELDDIRLQIATQHQ